MTEPQWLAGNPRVGKERARGSEREGETWSERETRGTSEMEREEKEREMGGATGGKDKNKERRRGDPWPSHCWS